MSRYLDQGDAIPMRPAVAKALATRYTNQFAAKSGRDDALFLQQLQFQLARKGGVDHDGQHYVYKSKEEWANELAMGESEFRACRDRLVDAGFVVKIENPGNAFLKRRWYRLDSGALDEFLESQIVDPLTITDRTEEQVRSNGERPPMGRGGSTDGTGNVARLNTEITNIEDKQRQQTYTRALREGEEVLGRNGFKREDWDNEGLKRKGLRR